jgi:uncharacterized protein
VPASTDVLADGWALYRSRSDKDWGIMDCTSFAIMTTRKIADSLTSDHPFKQAGFTVLL